MNLELQETVEALSRAAMHDPLKGMYNWRAFMDQGGKTVQARRRNQQQSMVAIRDLDHFKQINDTFGHDGGDAVLVSVAGAIATKVKLEDDVCARLGGEEFGIIGSARNCDEALEFLESLRSSIEQLTVPISHRPPNKHPAGCQRRQAS